MLDTDSSDYHVLTQAVAQVVADDVPGLLLEIGTRAGGSAKVIIDALTLFGISERTLVCVDPWGNIEYAESDTSTKRLDYTNAMRDQCLAELYAYALGKRVNVLVFPLEDRQFFARFPDGVPVYRESLVVEDKYALVFFDGPHSVTEVGAEVGFMLPRTPVGGVYVFDDIGNYNHALIETSLLTSGFVPLARTALKASYQRAVPCVHRCVHCGAVLESEKAYHLCPPCSD